MTDTALLSAVAQVEHVQATGALPVVRTFFDEATFTATHVVHDPATGRAAIVDPVRDFDQAAGRTANTSADSVLSYIAEQGLHVDWLLETHAHADHLSAAPYLKEACGGEIVIGRDIVTVQKVFSRIFNEAPTFVCDGSQFDRLLGDGDGFTLGSIPSIALHVPGHTPACLAYVIGDAAFVGDTLFMPDYGSARTDFPGGDARTLYRSIRRLMRLPESTRIFLCHDYKAPGRDHYAWETTVAAERRDNIHANDSVSEDDFVRMREARDKGLAVPRLLLPSIQVNIRAGQMPDPESNGVSYLKLPLNLL